MFRNTESHFAQVPNIEIQRSKMRIPFEHKTTWNNGDVVPIYFDGDILPGDTVKMTHSAVVRLQTLLTPIMDNLVMDFYWFFVPYRLVWNKWKEFMQENTAGPWAPSQQYQIPTISAPSGGFATGGLADYLGYPTGINWSNSDINAPSALPFRGYALICNEFFRDENLTYPLNIPKDSSNQTGTNGNSFVNDVANGGKLFKAAKTHDYWTSMLPSAQKAAQPVTFPLLNGNNFAPVQARNAYVDTSLTDPSSMGLILGGIPSLPDPANTAFRAVSNASSSPFNVSATALYNFDNAAGQSIAAGSNNFRPVNLWADLTNNVGSVTVNELRLAFQLQKWYERAALGGTRYTELIKSMFSVTSPDARLQRPEYLGGNRIGIQINQITNTSSDSGSSSVPLGNVGGQSATSDVNTDFVHSFTEHGMLFGLAVCRIQSHSYSQGMPKSLLRKTFTDFYWPVFAHLGEQATPKVCLYANGYMNSDDVFGYQECWAEYRYRPNMTTALMKPTAYGTLASWHLGDNYASAPTLSDAWIREGTAEVDRVLAVTSAVSDQYLGDFFFEAEYTRPMPVYSIPGLIDHF